MTFVSITPTISPLHKTDLKTCQEQSRSKYMSWKLFMWWFKHLYLAFSCRPQTNMLFFKFIWLYTGFRETWKFSFKTKTLGSFGCRYNYSPNHNRVVREQTRSRPASCMIGLIRENLTADNAFPKQRPRFCSQILHWPPKKKSIFQVANGADTIYVFLFSKGTARMNSLSLWHYQLTSDQRLQTLKEHAKHSKHLRFSCTKCCNSSNTAYPTRHTPIDR